MKKIIFSMLVLLGISGSTMAQDAYYALQFNQQQPFGTARFMGMAGAFGALGGDLSVASTNPAGLGLFRRSEFSGSLGFLGSEAEGTYLNNTVNRSSNELDMSQLAYLGHIPLQSDWKQLNIAIGYNRTVNFDSKFDFAATSPDVSLMNYYAYLANGTSYLDLESYSSPSMLSELAWNTYLIDSVPFARPYTYFPMDEGQAVHQQVSVQTTGGVSEFFLSMAGSYNDKFYIGATLGIRSLSYNRKWQVTESDEANLISDFDNYTYSADLLTEGTGVNLKIGMLYRIGESTRLGASFETPTYYRLEYWFTHSMDSHFKNGDAYSAETSTNYSYDMVSPWRASLSLAEIIGKRFILSADVDYLNYQNTTFSADDYNYDNFENPEVETELNSALNIKVGAEMRLGLFSLRGGYGFYGNPYSDEISVNGARHNITFGAGFRSSRFYFDFAHSMFSGTSQEFFVDKWDATQAQLKLQQNVSQFSIGLFF